MNRPGFTAIYLHQGRKEQARREAEAALKLNPADIDARHWLAMTCSYSGDIATARTLEMENVVHSGRFFPSRMHLADLARQEGNWEAAVRELERVLEYDSQNHFVLQLLAQIYLHVGNLPKARRTLDAARPRDKQTFRMRAVEALLLALEGKRNEASKAMDSGLIAYLELNPLMTLMGAEFYALTGDSSQALYWMERAVRNGDERATWFACDPALTTLRQDLKFRQIISSVTGGRHQVNAQR
jgi:tetratricopeptide (TPR) repeat protein